MMAGINGIRLEDQNRDELLETARLLLVETDALSSRIAAVNEIGVVVNRSLNMEAILKAVTKHLKWLMDFEYCSLCLKTDMGWRIVEMFGKMESTPENILETENVGRALRTRQSQLVKEGSPSPFMHGYKSQMIVPLITEEGALGAINFAISKPGCYSTNDLRIAYMLSLQLAGAIRNARNFEQLVQARDSVQRYADELEARNEELDAFSHTIAHDLKSPLSVVIMNADLLLRSPMVTDLATRSQVSLESVKAGAVKMNTMIDQLLWIARLRNLKDAITKVAMTRTAHAALLRFSGQLKAKGIKATVEPMPDACGISAWVEEVFANLFSNAIKYMGDGAEPMITIGGFQQGEYIRFEVRDTGIGISAADQERLFKMFARLHTVRAEGIGLGLSIVQRIVTKLGGQVGVESEPGKGSTFWFVLPAAP